MKRIKEFLMRPSLLFGLGSGLGLTVFAWAIFVYRENNLIHLGGLTEINKDYFGIFGDFVGGVVGTIFTIIATILIWLTINLKKKN